MAETVSYTYQAPFMGIGIGVIVRSTDGAFIPLNLGNRDYQEFLAWIAEGNTAPTGWTGPTNPTASPEPPTEGTA